MITAGDLDATVLWMSPVWQILSFTHTLGETSWSFLCTAGMFCYNLLSAFAMQSSETLVDFACILQVPFVYHWQTKIR